MNSRILSLAKQAGLKSQSETALSVSEAKFAELIVDEICKIVQLDGEILLPMIIKEHFGVEE